MCHTRDDQRLTYGEHNCGEIRHSRQMSTMMQCDHQGTQRSGKDEEGQRASSIGMVYNGDSTCSQPSKNGTPSSLEGEEVRRDSGYREMHKGAR